MGTKVLDFNISKIGQLNPELARGLIVLDSLSDADKKAVYQAIMAQVSAQIILRHEPEMQNDLLEIVEKAYKFDPENDWINEI